jgi:16S rRNA (cytidine1402-2'-O)-methyltransferase
LNSGILYVVSSPIGNLGDLSYRAVDVLSSVQMIAAEDTRTTSILLKKYSINKKCISYHEKNENIKFLKIIDLLNEGLDIALISDAGTPCLSDPGYRIVNAARKSNIEVVSIPGASSITAALSISGLPSDHFYFEGFLPKKKGRKTRLEFLSSLDCSIVIFESPNRIIKTLNSISEYFGNRAISICREITKVYEENYFGYVDEILIRLDEVSKIRGEFVLIVSKKGYKID